MFYGQTDLSEIPSLSGKESQSLLAVGIQTVANLLNHFPKRYEDRRQFDRFPNQATAKPVCLTGGVIDATTKGFGKTRFYEAIIMDGDGGVFGSGKITCRWFNMPFMSKVVAAGHQVIAYGKVKEQGGRLIIDHPEIEIIREDEDETETIHLNRIVPIYKNISGINQRRLREIIHTVAADCIRHADDNPLPFPYPVANTNRTSDLLETHFPISLESAHTARRRFALEDFFTLQLNVVWQRNQYLAHQGRILGKKTTLLKAFYHSLPFDLTNAQKRSIKEIIADMRSPRPMNRLLQGDVGSGKTFVALASMLLAIDSGADAALMAPTQILAEQHYLTFRKWLEPLGINIVLRTAAHKKDTQAESSTDLSAEASAKEDHCSLITRHSSEAKIIIGTHALLYDPTLFTDLGLVVIDEQHKFGVVQRAKLIEQGTLPDVLVMTATPIPRSLTMTIYGDLDVSLLDEKPAGRGKIITALRNKPKQKDITDFVKAQLKEGRQAYLVYPLVEESDSVKAESAITAFAKWQKRLGAENVGLIHGKLRPEEKEAVMDDFRSGKTKALVATTVIEVGVDVPNANLMIIHHAERFGLAQIHQLRGRIGRGEHKSYCILLTDSKLPESIEKLSVLEKTADGFEIAEADLRLRGPGDILGTAQSGLSDLRFADFITDTELIREARALADNVFKTDPDLTASHSNLRLLIRESDAPQGAH
ncbi:MAG: ATP-dependent DNA helicase RecG [Akkermansiaceae bacterium]|nr:ATP-dependent DNA helicase RecG [Akkermansiaceae bacterium]MDP4722128.1 ATP-dependent DNA helicase RecG [Akkermansiaceae bacterium]MDP4781653.1 ATP-dependent DNA helicase RecG [Akkermansiaceae bacterium]MDP4847935.1 ATP-dependent DNA helicase RecG [Akkermansiaceae bacterium]MDP4899046.1 ATP-dependent DNA helicase RecG [Akkermansiaceae bacterium]